MAERKSFYVTLPSNACHNIFPNNSSSEYTTVLSTPIELQGPYEVALAEITYCHTWNNIDDTQCSFEFTKGQDGRLYHETLKIPHGYYGSIQQLVKEMTAVIGQTHKEINVEYDPIPNRVILKKQRDTTANFAIQLRPPLAYMLGFKASKWVQISEYTLADHPADIHGGQYNFMVYTNIVEAQHVGDYMVPLLRIVKMEGQYGDVVTLSYDRLHYVPVNKQLIQTLLIELKTDLNQLIRFTYGKTICKLHFRPITRSII